jgi:hypothetical protein
MAIPTPAAGRARGVVDAVADYRHMADARLQCGRLGGHGLVVRRVPHPGRAQVRRLGMQRDGADRIGAAIGIPVASGEGQLAEFGDAAGEPVGLNIFRADNDPVHRVATYIPWQIADGTSLLDEEIPHPYGIHGILEDRGHVMARYEESVMSRPATADEEGHLRLRPGVWVLDVWHTSFDTGAVPYELTRFVMRSDMTGLDFSMRVD